MYIECTLYLLVMLSLSSNASLFSPTSHGQDALQQPLIPTSNLSPNFHVRAASYHGRCPPGYHWGCHFYRKVYCACFANHPFQSSKIGPEHNTDSSSRSLGLLAAAQNVTALEVLTEIQPGNNKTLASLFEIHCDEGRQHVACVQTDSGFACGCHDNWDTTAIGAGWYDNNVDKGGNYREKSDDMSDDMVIDNPDLLFQWHRFPKCPPGLFFVCCPTFCPTSCPCKNICRCWKIYGCPICKHLA